MRYVFVLTLILALALGLSIFVGYRQPPSALMQTLHLEDCTPPCWLGLTAGRSTLTDAFQLLLPNQTGGKPQAEPIRTSGQIFTYFPTGNIERTVEFVASQGRIDAIVLPGDFGNRQALDIPMLSVGDIIAWLGKPSCVATSDQYRGEDIVFDTEFATLIVTMERKVFNPTQPIYRLSIQPYIAHTDPCHFSIASSWRGFVSAGY